MEKKEDSKRTLRCLMAVSLFLLMMPFGCTSSLRSVPGSSGPGWTGEADPGARDADGGGGVGAGKEDGVVDVDTQAQSEEAEDVSFLSELEEQGEAAVGEGSIRVEKNHQVDYFVSLFSGPDRDWVRKALGRSGRYIDRIREILREEEIPEDLAYLALIESGYNPYAYSRSGAVGVWQFMPFTGRRYGLVIDWWIDERRDLEKSTRAAARYLKDLYRLFDDWDLAAAAYNAGEGKLGRAIKRYNTNNFWDLSRKSYLKQETRNYVPRFHAILTIARDPDIYGFGELQFEDPLLYEVVPVKRPLDLAAVAEGCGCDVGYLKKLNPQLSRGCTPPSYPGEYGIKIPAGTRERFLEYHSKLEPSKHLTFVRHRIRRGETLARIADRYGIAVKPILELNRLASGGAIRPGNEIVVPVPAGYRPTQRASSGNPSGGAAQAVSSIPGAAKASYEVRDGESLWSIARDCGIPVSRLMAWNGLDRSSTIQTGQKLVIWKAGAGGSKGRSTHVVRRGDSLWGIATAHGVSLDSLKSWNGLSNSSKIHPGQRLRVRPEESHSPQLAAARIFSGKSRTGPAEPRPRWYTVRSGDTLWSIAQLHGITVAQLCQWNGMSTRRTIHPGLRLRIYRQQARSTSKSGSLVAENLP